MDESLGGRFSRAISLILHPLIMPTLGAWLLLFGPTVMREVPVALKVIMLSTVAFYSLLLPLSLYVIAHYIQRLNGLNDSLKSLLPMGVVALCLVVCAVAIHQIVFSFLVFRVLVAALCCLLVSMGVSFFTKLNLHLVALGGLLGLLGVLCGIGIGRLQTAFVVALLATGLLASAQLYLNKNNALQVLYSVLCGMVVAVSALILG